MVLVYNFVVFFFQTKEEIYFVKGAMEKILQQCTKYLWNGVAHPLNAKKEQEYLAEAYEIGRKGLRGNVVTCVCRKYFITCFCSVPFLHFSTHTHKYCNKTISTNMIMPVVGVNL